MTKNAFLDMYRAVLVDMHGGYGWAGDATRLERFMASAAATINAEATSWDHTGEAANRAWRAIGGKGKPSLKALRALA